jgi:hypothetical protein
MCPARFGLARRHLALHFLLEDTADLGINRGARAWGGVGWDKPSLLATRALHIPSLCWDYIVRDFIFRIAFWAE